MTDVNIDIFQGATFLMTVNLQQKNEAGDIVPFNTSGYSLRGQIRRSYKATTSYDFTFNVLDAAQGKIEVVLSAVDTAAMPKGAMVYDVEVFNPADTDVVYKALRGTATVHEEVTRP